MSRTQMLREKNIFGSPPVGKIRRKCSTRMRTSFLAETMQPSFIKAQQQKLIKSKRKLSHVVYIRGGKEGCYSETKRAELRYSTMFLNYCCSCERTDSIITITATHGYYLGLRSPTGGLLAISEKRAAPTSDTKVHPSPLEYDHVTGK